jgi:hypothetical protein
MPEFNASLLREKFIITVPAPPGAKETPPVIALSNRLVVPLIADNGRDAETFVVRAQNMHICARFSAQIAREFQEGGPLLTRKKPFDWPDAWDSVVQGYEKNWNPNRWVAVYHKGKVVFEDGPGQRHMFLDIIEQCDARTSGNYPDSLEVAKEAFRKAGKIVNIQHDSNIALIMNVSRKEGKCGLIVRSPARTTTFNMTLRKKKGADVRPSQCLMVAAAFFEGIQLAFLVGMARQKLKFDLITPSSPEGVQSEDAGRKLARLNTGVKQIENILEIVYRPDRPDFSQMIDESQEFAQKVLAGEIDRKIQSEPSDWVT